MGALCPSQVTPARRKSALLSEMKKPIMTRAHCLPAIDINTYTDTGIAQNHAEGDRRPTAWSSGGCGDSTHAVKVSASSTAALMSVESVRREAGHVILPARAADTPIRAHINVDGCSLHTNRGCASRLPSAHLTKIVEF